MFHRTTISSRVSCIFILIVCLQCVTVSVIIDLQMLNIAYTCIDKIDAKAYICAKFILMCFESHDRLLITKDC